VGPQYVKWVLKFGRQALTFQNRRPGHMDAYIEWDDQYNCLFCLLGPGRESGSPAYSDHDRSRSGPDGGTQRNLSFESDLVVPLACTTRDAITFLD
jgi:hypothetical protein